MKKINKSAASPNGLKLYYDNFPLNSWEQIRGNDRDAVLEIKNQLIGDQKGLCAYCEIDLATRNGNGVDDFRVEHFVPKNPHNPPPNNALDWFNLRGVCSGGNQKDVCISARFTSPDHSCDVPKSDKQLAGTILDPLHDVDAFPRLFEYIEQGEEAGRMMVDFDLCPEPVRARAENTIKELHLNADRLKRLRKAVIDSLRESIEEAVSHGQSLEDARTHFADVFLTPSIEGQWQAFFTCVRWYLGPAAEDYLHGINFQG